MSHGIELLHFIVAIILILTKHPVRLLATLRFQPHHSGTNIRKEGMNIHADFDSGRTGQLGPLILVLRENIRHSRRTSKCSGPASKIPVCLISLMRALPAYCTSNINPSRMLPKYRLVLYSTVHAYIVILVPLLNPSLIQPASLTTNLYLVS